MAFGAVPDGLSLDVLAAYYQTNRDSMPASVRGSNGGSPSKSHFGSVINISRSEPSRDNRCRAGLRD